MKKIGFLSLILAFCFAASAQTTPSATEVLTPVYAKAKAGKKKVLLIFHASWCGWCRKMDSSLADVSVKPLMDANFEITHLTVEESPNKKHLENPGGKEVLAKVGGVDKGLPYWAILDAESSMLANSQHKPGDNTGCPASAEEVEYFIQVLKKTSGLTAAELEKVRIRFRKNETK